MSETIRQLRAKWNKEKESYKSQELGTGVQSFVKDVLKCNLLFNLKEGKLSTPRVNRKNEFIHVSKTIQRRSVDFRIYVDPEIEVPVEVERYTLIKQGEGQLLQYQTDLDKKYGILTDGYSWRFYNSNYIDKEFSIDTIFKNPALFRTYWKEHIKPRYYYLRFFEKSGQLELFEHTWPVEKNLDAFFKDITTLIEGFKNKLQIEGYFNGLGEKERRRRATEITYAHIIQFILYKTLVDNAFGNFQKDYKNIIEEVHKNIKDERYKDILGIITGISKQISENIYKPFSQEQEFISQKLWFLFQSRKNTLAEVSPWLDIFVFIKKYNFQNIQTEVFGYVYENYLSALFEEQKRGLFYTHPAVVNFMLAQIGYTPEIIKKKVQQKQVGKLSLIDPCCGSGTFLYRAVDNIIYSYGKSAMEKSKEIQKLVNDNVFGLDISEFSLYLAEMAILMRMLPLIFTEKYNNPVEKKIKLFFTRDSIAEFRGSGINSKEKVKDKHKGQLQLGLMEQEPVVESLMRNTKDVYDMKYSLQKRGNIPRRRFDYVIANPPYVSYNECSKQKLLSFNWIKKGKLKLNNIYGVNLHSVPDNPKRYRPNPNLYAFFIALGLALLKDNAKICYIIPQTILTAGDLDVIRYHLAKYITIEKIFVFSSKLFIGRGLKLRRAIPTSSLIFVASNKKPNHNQGIEVVSYKESKKSLENTIENILKGKNVIKTKIKQSLLQENIVNWNFIKQTSKLMSFYEEYKRNTEDISIYYEHKIALSKFNCKFYFDSGYSIDERRVLRERPNGNYYIYPKLDKTIWTIKLCKGFWPNIRKDSSPHAIKLRQANQGYNLLDSKYKVVWSYINPARFHFTSTPVIWARNQFCAIGSKNRKELLYIFAILNSSLVNLVLNSNLKSEQEKDYLVPTKAIKDFVRVPKINRDNQCVKEEIIQAVEEMLALEEKILSDFVDFSGILMQRFKEVRIEKNCLLLIDGNKITKLEIKNNPELVRNILNHELNSDQLKFENKKVRLSYLRSLPIIDFERQKNLKDYIDLLVFALYCNIPLEKVKFSRVKEIKGLCSKNKYFTMVTECQR